MKKSFIPQAPRQDDFTFIYNDQEAHVSKFQFALYSAKFRRIPEFFSSNLLTLKDDPPFTVFCQFLRAAQGIETRITVDNAIDILHFCDVWEVDTVATEVRRTMSTNSELEKTIQKILNAKKKDSFAGLENIIAENFDTAVQIQSLSEFPIRSLNRIVNNPRCIIKKPQRYYQFVKRMLNRVGSDASFLAGKVDITRLSSEEAIEFLRHPKLIKSFIAESLTNAAIALLQDNTKFISQMTEYHNQLNQMAARLEKLEKTSAFDPSDPSDVLKHLNKKITSLEAKVSSSNDGNSADVNDKITKALNKIDAMCNETLENISKSFTEVETRAHKDLRKTNKIVNGLTKKSGTLENAVISMRSDNNELKNSMTSIVRKIIESEESLKRIKNMPASSGVSSPVKHIIVTYNGQPYNGMFAKLAEMANGDPHLKKLINVSASSSDRNEAYQITDSHWNDFFFTEDIPNSWILFDFKDKKVHLTHYTLRTHKYGSGTCHLKYWILEGSNNGKDWDEIDKRNTPVLNGPNRFQTFPSTKTHDKFQFIRIRQVGANFRGDNIFAIASIEFFGTIYL
ncbi:F5/8 type C domain containing protein [Tritrichomonas foetus]|uniref:F5/8 type C domain containing protein n=1 Tax=Tritrichomonas foetus TaxID=1144522 RepID=A0A1J4J870_9EUKA|nr:F5/8 type C domain containing protein [Tritrichomonas foetus]|eukprot:OHS93605.1 F5/8 type C domain containing protein [Tritrichomonas foetus]